VVPFPRGVYAITVWSVHLPLVLWCSIYAWLGVGCLLPASVRLQPRCARFYWCLPLLEAFFLCSPRLCLNWHDIMTISFGNIIFPPTKCIATNFFQTPVLLFLHFLYIFALLVTSKLILLHLLVQFSFWYYSRCPPRSWRQRHPPSLLCHSIQSLGSLTEYV